MNCWDVPSTSGKTIQERKKWQCTLCAWSFKYKYLLVNHEKQCHSEEGKHRCEICSRVFKTIQVLTQHLAIHFPNDSHKCEICKKSFSRHSTLKAHQRTHLEPKAFKCSICPRAFHQKGNLKFHMFTHTNERPFRCEQCAKRFNQPANLRCHIVKIHGMAQGLKKCDEERKDNLHSQYLNNINRSSDYKIRIKSSLENGVSLPNIYRKKILNLHGSNILIKNENDPFLSGNERDEIIGELNYAAGDTKNFFGVDRPRNSFDEANMNIDYVE